MTRLRSREALRIVLRGATAQAALLAGLASTHAALAAEPLVGEELLVVDDRIVDPNTQAVVAGDLNTPPARDTGDFLSRLQGIVAGRMGGHGTEISIRGQSADRIAIINDGAYVFGGCPNRMDPPASSVALQADDKVIVRRGYQSVMDGPPAPAGTVSIEHASPAAIADGFSGRIGGGFDSNGETRFGTLSMQAAAGNAYARGFAHDKRASNYKDGSGREVRSAFDQYGGGAEAGWRYGAGSAVSFSAEADRVSDALFSGAGMDSPWTSVNTYRFNLDHKVEDAGMLKGVKANVYGSFVTHLMDNYTLRPLTGMMKMRTDATSDTWGGKIAADLVIEKVALTVGIDHRTNNRDAESRSSNAMSTPTMISGYTWPDMTIRDTGLFAQGDVPVAAATTLTLGARLDLVSTDAGKADAVPQTGVLATARQSYAMYYGTSDVSRNEANVSGLIRLTHDFGPVTGWTGLSQAVRTADATERGIVRRSMTASGNWVGNPGLDPERHRQFDIGVGATRKLWNASVSGWYDDVADFISRDKARGQAGILRSDGADIFRNVDARLMGFDVAAAWVLAEQWRLSGDATYTYGRNTTDDRPLYQIPPLTGSVELAYENGPWSAGSTARWALKQTRADTSTVTGTGLDTRETPGYVAFDLFAGWKAPNGLELRGGVSNLFDVTYASHLSRSNGFDPIMVQVNEPGRSLYLQVALEF